MRLDTLIKLGSLAFSVAQDDKVRELLRITHRGMKRRGWMSPPLPRPYPVRRPPYPW
ncbi:MAG: hypothetical protein IRZ10_12125 [Thermoflavifilum sp.]|nr:hypothetical protein [Thermoflavifilum sp.]MCL6515147.1 hypothetical protein [Alicyclobacillus sp.]